MRSISLHWGLSPGPSVYKTDALPLSYRGSATHSNLELTSGCACCSTYTWKPKMGHELASQAANSANVLGRSPDAQSLKKIALATLRRDAGTAQLWQPLDLIFSRATRRGRSPSRRRAPSEPLLDARCFELQCVINNLIQLKHTLLDA